MAIYEFRCQNCGRSNETQVREASLYCDACGHQMKRVWSFQAAPVWQAHQNMTTGTVISDPRQFERELRQKSVEATERTGIPHNFVPADMSDVRKLGVTGEGLDATEKRKRETGELQRGDRLTKFKV